MTAQRAEGGEGGGRVSPGARAAQAHRRTGIDAQRPKSTEGVTALGPAARSRDVAQASPDVPMPGADGACSRRISCSSSGRPVLLIPYAGEFAEFDSHVLIAWNGSRESARALHDAMFFIEKADAVTVIEVDPPTSAREWRSRSSRRSHVVAALKRRGVEAAAAPTVSGGTPVADVILSLAADLGADLVVMGAYGHSRLRELVLGGVSRSMFQEMTVPVLMSH